MSSRKIIVLLPNVLKIASSWIDDLGIACHVFISPILPEAGECLVSNTREIQLVIAYIEVSSFDGIRR
jgi:hypothetical protein